MSRSRNRLIRPLLPLAALVACLVLAAPAFAAAAPSPSSSWSPKLAYVLTNGETRAELVKKLHLTKAQDDALRRVGEQLASSQHAAEVRSQLIVESGSLTLAEKRDLIRTTGYNDQLAAAETSASARAASALGVPVHILDQAVSEVWQLDAATHNLETELNVIGASASSVIGPGSFHVFGTHFDDPGMDQGVAVPDRYAKFANLGVWPRPSGYPTGRYNVSVYWDGVQHALSGTRPAASVINTQVVDVGPWNLDDNYWDNYADPVRPRRVNLLQWPVVDKYGNSSTFHIESAWDSVAGQAALPFGLPEAQAAYFHQYGYTTDQYGRKPTQPAAIDLTTPVINALGMHDNEWVDWVPLWEARLDVVGSIQMTPGPYITGQKVTFTYTVKNLGSLTGTWDSLRFLLRRANGMFDYGPATGPVMLAPGASKTFSFTHTLDSTGTTSGCPDALRGGSWGAVGTASVTLSNVAKRTVDRLGGTDRYETAVAMSKAAYPATAKAVVIATGLNFPDALSGAALAHAEDGPMLLVGKTLPASVEAEVKRLKPAKIILLGSESVVSAEVASKLASDVPGAAMSRLGGWDRYSTARLIAQQVVSHYGGKAPNGTVIVATGRSFPDALSASVLSADKGWPILLTETSVLPTDTIAALSAVSATNSFVIGSDKVVADSVKTGLPAATRLGGADRYETAALVSDLAETKGLSYAYIGLAVGTNYPDALAGGVLAAKGWGTMLLTPPTGLASSVRTRFQEHRTVTTHLQAYGSTDALPAATLSAAEDALR